MEEMKHVLFTAFGLPVTAYALGVVMALAAGLCLLWWEQRRNHLRADTAEIFALLALPLGLIGARLFYCLARLDVYLEMGAGSILRLWEGGYALWGAVGGAVLAALLTAKMTRQSPVKLLDALAAPAALTIALSRFAEGFNGEGIGLEVYETAFQRFPFAVFNADWEIWNWAIFMLEGAAALAILALMLVKRLHRHPGDRAKLFVILYCSSQILLESLRRDQFLRWLFVRVSQLTAALVLSGLMFCALARWVKAPQEARMAKKHLIWNWVAFLACVGICIGMEFAVDKSAAMPVWLCYSVMALCCAVMGVTSWQLIMRSVPKKK